MCLILIVFLYTLMGRLQSNRIHCIMRLKRLTHIYSLCTRMLCESSLIAWTIARSVEESETPRPQIVLEDSTYYS